MSCYTSSANRFCSPQQTTIITQTIPISFYEELYRDLPEITVGNRIKKQRMIRNFSQRGLANVIGSSNSTIEDYESSKAYPSPKILAKISKALTKPIEYFYDDYYEFIFSDFKSIIKNWREQNDLTFWQAAKLTGIDYRSIRDWENGRVMSRPYFEIIKNYINL